VKLFPVHFGSRAEQLEDSIRNEVGIDFEAVSGPVGRHVDEDADTCSKSKYHFESPCDEKCGSHCLLTFFFFPTTMSTPFRPIPTEPQVLCGDSEFKRDKDDG
jgi:hypothetical protein